MRDDLAEVEHIDVVADVQHQAHVVIDQEQTDAEVEKAAQVLSELLALLRIKAGGRFVE